MRARIGLHGSRINHYRLSRTLLLVKYGYRDVVHECQNEEHYDRGGKKTLVSFLSLLIFIISAFNVYIMRHASGKKHTRVCV